LLLRVAGARVAEVEPRVTISLEEKSQRFKRNENDKVLGYSNAVNPPRLGNTLRDLEADNATYVDFTEAAGVGTNHQLWGEVASKNVVGFFAAAFTGRRAEDVPGLRFDPRLNAFRMA
jgi:hypothetical protein